MLVHLFPFNERTFLRLHCSLRFFANLALSDQIHGSSNIYVKNLKSLFHQFPSIRIISRAFKPSVLRLFIVSLFLPVIFQGHEVRRKRFDGLWQNRSENGSARNSIVLQEETVRQFFGGNKAARSHTGLLVHTCFTQVLMPKFLLVNQQHYFIVSIGIMVESRWTAKVWISLGST